MHERWNARRAHEEIQEELRHQHWLLHKILERMDQIMSAYTDLTREVAETREVIMAKLAEMQAEIDIIKADPADVAAVTAAAAALDQLQTDITGAVPPPPPEEPVL